MKKYLCATAMLFCSTLPLKADILSTVGLSVIAAPSVTVQADWIPINGLPPQLIFAELKGVTLSFPLGVDTGAAIPAGTVVDSYFLGLGTHNFALGNVSASTSATFDSAILGIIYTSSVLFQASANFAASDFLGAPNVTYRESDCPTLGFGCAFETSLIPGYLDAASFSGDTASFFNDYFYPGDVARIIVAHAVPGPIAGAGLPVLGAAFAIFLAAWRRRRRHLYRVC